MKRREFLKGSIAVSAAAGLVPALAPTQATAASKGKQEVYELRIYRQKPGANTSLLETYLERAALPAWNRLGSRPIGVFKDREGKEAGIFVLIPYNNMNDFLAAPGQLAKDREYASAGADYLQTAKNNPGFERIDSWLLLAFSGMPKIELAAHSKQRNPSRIFELRTYESYSEAKAAKKVDMFNAGEIDTMREVGLAPVFYGQALIGANLPHLTYMTSGENEEAHKKHWDAFGKHPTWDKLKNDPQYADTVSKITKYMLTATAYSQI